VKAMQSWKVISKCVAAPAALTLCKLPWSSNSGGSFRQGRSFAQCETMPRGSRQQFEGIKAFREKLQKGETLVGIGIQLTDPVSTDALCDCADFFWFDMEHTPMSPTELKVHMLVAHGKGCPCIVRVPGPNRVDGVALPWGIFIKHALDANADAIAVPQVRTAEEVRSIVADCRYPQGGSRPPPFDVAQPSTQELKHRYSRGFGPTIPMNYGRIPQPVYLEAADKNIFVCAMIETVEAIENVDEIASVPGLDCLILGANDLSAALGVPYLNEHPLTAAATDKIMAAAKKAWQVCNVQYEISRSSQKNGREGSTDFAYWS